MTPFNPNIHRCPKNLFCIVYNFSHFHQNTVYLIGFLYSSCAYKLFGFAIINIGHLQNCDQNKKARFLFLFLHTKREHTLIYNGENRYSIDNTKTNLLHYLQSHIMHIVLKMKLQMYFIIAIVNMGKKVFNTIYKVGSNRK